MIHKVFSIRDSAADAYLPPFILPKSEMAKRIFGQCVNSDDHQFAKSPEDYTLFEIGTFDDELGQLGVYRSQENLGNGINYALKDDYQATEGQSNGASIPQEPHLLSSSGSEDSTE
jgi:hypothetical protein